MRQRLRKSLLAAFFGSFLAAHATLAQQQTISIWLGAAPGSENWTQKESVTVRGNEHFVRNVVQPSLIEFAPTQGTSNGTAMIICPGGGFAMLAIDTEGTSVAKWLAARGVHAFVLKYRLTETSGDALPGRPGAAPGRASELVHPDGIPVRMDRIRAIAVGDALQALKVVRQRAREWRVAPDRIGIIGFSAGAITTTGVLEQYGADTRPNFAASIYGNTIEPSKVPSDAPPIFIAAANDDPRIPPVDSANLYLAWKSTGHSAELHIYSKGGHAFGAKHQGLPVDHWIDAFGDWLALQGLLEGAH